MKLALGSLILAVLGWLGLYQPQPPQKPAQASSIDCCIPPPCPPDCPRFP